jgi:TonB family protein
MLFADEPSALAFEWRRGVHSLAASLLLHAAFGVAVVGLAWPTPPRLSLQTPSRQFVLITGLPAPRFRPTAPHAPPRSALRVPKPVGPQQVTPGRLFVAPRAVVASTPALIPLLTPAPVLAVQLAPRFTPVPGMLRLGPAPVRTGEFTEIRPSPLKLLNGPSPAPVLAAFGSSERRSPDVAQPALAIASGSFGDAGASTRLSAARDPVIAASGFRDVSAAPATPPAKPTPIRNVTPVEIQFKPVPEYTDEGRRRHIEGEVLLEMLFTASGEARLLRLVRGLGYGLDESAEAAAKQVRFLPARRDGSPVDSQAIVRIQFQLAY